MRCHGSKRSCHIRICKELDERHPSDPTRAAVAGAAGAAQKTRCFGQRRRPKQRFVCTAKGLG